MSKIFLSYRRADTSGYVIAIYDRLIQTLSSKDIFRDLDTIDYGEDFVEVIENAVQQCDVLLAIIGQQWVKITDAEGQRRLDNPEDFVRLEIAIALRRNIRVIPVLVGGATMPSADDLPEDLKRLVRRNALEIRDRDFQAHMERLIRAINRALAATQSHKLPTHPQTKPQKLSKQPIEELVYQEVVNILSPPFEWIEIPAGKVVINDRTEIISTFAIAKYPITKAQFTQFIEAGGYTKPDYWTQAGWQEKENGNWTSPRPHRKQRGKKSNRTEHPVIGVSWYEAYAFTRWLSKMSGENIKLPTEKQWQRAAQGDDGRTYPWGNEWDCQRCNNNVNPCKGRQTTIVTKYEGKGDSPFGVVDMAGNVWEWCLTRNDSGTNDPRGTQVRVLCGGSWFNVDTYLFSVVARGDFELETIPATRGFRIVCSHT